MSLAILIFVGYQSANGFAAYGLLNAMLGLKVQDNDW
jgi:hypothetical protein